MFKLRKIRTYNSKSFRISTDKISDSVHSFLLPLSKLCFKFLYSCIAMVISIAHISWHLLSRFIFLYISCACSAKTPFKYFGSMICFHILFLFLCTELPLFSILSYHKYVFPNVKNPLQANFLYLHWIALTILLAFLFRQYNLWLIHFVLLLILPVFHFLIILLCPK